MRVEGRRIRRMRLIQTDRYVVAIEVEAVIPDADPSEPVYEAETVELLREIEAHAQAGDLTWLQGRGKVYAAVDAA